MSNSTRNYLSDFDYRVYSHTASASQFDSYLTCPRKWWLSKVIRLPELQRQNKFEFGDRLHEVCERFLDADDQGRDRETGQPVELYPPGWDEGLTSFDASIIKRIIEKGIEEGVLRRLPGRQIEAPVGIWDERKRKFVPRPIVPGVGVAGYRDMKAPGVVEDHKSVMSRRYCKTQADLLADPQMLLYAAIEIIETVEAGGEIPEKVLLRHNQFIKDPNDLGARVVEVALESGVVQDFWEQIIEPAAADMLSLKKGHKDQGRWDEIEGPRKKGACASYGGCPFQRICGKVESPQDYRDRIQRINAIEVEPEAAEMTTITATEATKETQIMGIFDRVKTAAATPAPSPEPVAPVAEAPKPAKQKAKAPVAEVEYEEVEEAAEATAEATEATEATFASDVAEALASIPPWANTNCTACEGVGFNSKALPCAACDRVAEREGLPRAGAFTVATDDAGYTSWTRTADDLELGRVQLQAAEVKTKETRKPATEKTQASGATKRNRFAKLAEANEEILPSAKTGEIEDVKPAPEKTTKKTGTRGRGATGFTLLYGSVCRASSKMMDLGQIFAEYSRELAASQGVESFYLLDRFKRGDLLASKAKEIAATIPNATIVVVRADDADMRRFASAIEPFANNVLEGRA